MKTEIKGWRDKQTEAFFNNKEGMTKDRLGKLYAFCPKFSTMVSSDNFDWTEGVLKFICVCGDTHEAEV